MASRISCFYGPPFSGKTSAIITLIAAMHRETGKKARVLIGDGSAVNYYDSGLVKKGVVELYDYSAHDYPSTTTRQLCQNYWPKDVEDSNSPLEPTPREKLADYGILVIEGLSVMSEYILGSVKGGFAFQAGYGVKIGQDSPVNWQDAEIDPRTGQYIQNRGTGMKFGGNPLSHYKMVQRHMLDNLRESKSFPGWVIWTAHEAVTEDEGEKVIGPEVAGKALSPKIGRQFNELLHFTKATKVAQASDAHTGARTRAANIEYRIYTHDHYDPDGLVMIKYLAGVRTQKPELIKPYYTGASTEAISSVYRDLHKAQEAFEATLADSSAAA